MAGKLSQFAENDLRPRPRGWRGFFAAVLGPTLGHFVWLPNWLRVNSQNLFPFALAIVIFIITFTTIDLLLEYGLSIFPKLKELLLCNCAMLLNDAGDLRLLKKLLRKLLSGVAHSLNGTPGYGIAVTYFIARFIQHASDWRGWHATWFTEHWDRVCAKLGHPGAGDFPILILGGGGSGKSTLAQILRYGFLRRQIFKPTGFQYEGGDENIVVRSAENAIGGPVGKYDVTWRPEMYKVGRLAEAYDLPGQIKEDWKKAINKVKACRRVAIINVVTYGYNSSVRKFHPTIQEGKNEEQEIYIDVIDGAISVGKKNIRKTLQHKASKDVFKKYAQHVIKLEVEPFRQFVADEIINSWKKENGNPPKLMLIHVVNMADCWVDASDGIKDAASKSAKVLEFYEHEFSKMHCDLKRHFERENGEFVHKFLPASFQFGETRHSEEKGFIIFNSAFEFQNKNFEDRIKEEVEKKAMLGQATVKTIRAIRLALYKSYSDSWGDKKAIGVDYPLKGYEGSDLDRKDDIYDVWRKAEQ